MRYIYVDFDDTICSGIDWKNIFYNTYHLFFRSKLYFKPDYIFSEYSILTARPKIDLPLLYLYCKIHKLKPVKIITNDKLFYTPSCRVDKFLFLVDQAKIFPDDFIFYYDSDTYLIRDYNYLIQNNDCFYRPNLFFTNINFTNGENKL